MSKITWIRPSGSEIETNDHKATIEACVKLGWEKKQPKKRGPKPKVAEDGGNGSNSN